MKRIIVIGGCALQISLADGVAGPVNPSGRMLLTALELARKGLPVSLVSEAARDRVGDLIVSRLREQGIDVTGVDRYVGGHTPLDVAFAPDAEHPEASTVHYRAYPQADFDSIWPRVSRDDIVVIGDYFAIAPRNARFVREFVANARQARAIIVYAPGFKIHAGKQLTPVKPTLLDTLEWADFVIATATEMADFFRAKSLEKAYRDNIAFYCRNFIGIGEGAVNFFSQGPVISLALPAIPESTTPQQEASLIAALASAIASENVTHQELAEGLDADRRLALLTAMNPQ